MGLVVVQSFNHGFVRFKSRVEQFEHFWSTYFSSYSVSNGRSVKATTFPYLPVYVVFFVKRSTV